MKILTLNRTSSIACSFFLVIIAFVPTYAHACCDPIDANACMSGGNGPQCANLSATCKSPTTWNKTYTIGCVWDKNTTNCTISDACAGEVKIQKPKLR